MNELRKKIYDIIEHGFTKEANNEWWLTEMTDQIMSLIESHDKTKSIRELYDNNPELNKPMTQEEFDKARQAGIDLDGYDMSALLTPTPVLDELIKKGLEREQVQHLIDTFESQCQNYWNKDIKHRLIELNNDLTEDNEIMNLESLNLFIAFANIYPHIRPSIGIDPNNRIMIEIKDINAMYTIVFKPDNKVVYAVIRLKSDMFQNESTFDEMTKFLSSYSNIFTVKE